MLFENVWILIAILILSVYGLILMRFVNAFKKGRKVENQVISGLSIVLSIRNERDRIHHFFAMLSACEFTQIDIEIILVNDHSEDDTLARIQDVPSHFAVRVLNAPESISGKKQCAKWGVESAQFPWILTLDIDVELPVTFFRNISQAVPLDFQYAIIPLKPKTQISLARYFFDLEFMSLHFVGVASAKMGKPLLSNAACSIIRKEAFLETICDREDWEIPSGDDVFAMFAIAEKFGADSVVVAEMGPEKVEVDFPIRFENLLRQRIRWVGKSGQIKNSWFGFISLLVFTFNLILGNAIFQTVFNGFSTNHFVILSAALVIQFLFLTYVCKSVERRDLIKWIVPLTLVYPFYLIALVIAQFFWKPKWK